MALGWASKAADNRQRTRDAIAAKVAKLGLKTRYYNPDVHKAAFAVPEFVRQLIG
jgi:spermidine synthase